VQALSKGSPSGREAPPGSHPRELQPRPLLCPFCGQEAVLDVLEVWGTEFQLDTCCEGMLEDASAYLREGGREAGRWMSTSPTLQALGLGLGSPAGVRRVVEDGLQLRLDWHPRVVPVTLRQARAFVQEHHRHNAAPVGWRFGAGLANGQDLVAVVVVGRPVARALDPRSVVEITRMCAADTPLAWNACSQLMAWAAKEARRRGFRKLITYTRADEDGTSLKAGGWKLDGHVRARQWSCASRPRAAGQAIAKVRWAKELKSAAPAAAGDTH
jgi:hypothetical protein